MVFPGLPEEQFGEAAVEHDVRRFYERLFKGNYVPHVIEPSAGLDRMALAVIAKAFDEFTKTDDKGKSETITVLRFHPRVAGRVQESRWLRSQQVEVQPDGYLLWRAKVAEWQEMLPWIRGWGADVEVVAPVALRAELEREVRRLMQLYRFAQTGRGDDEDYDDARVRELFR